MSRPWMPLYVADYLADTAHLNAAQSGAYLHLIMHYWQRGGLPDDDAMLARIAKMTPDEFSNARALLQQFFSNAWKHERIEHELAESKAAYERRSVAGSKGGRAKSAKYSSNAKAMPQQCSDNAVATTTTISSSLRSEDRAPKRETGKTLPDDWTPPDELFAYGKENGLSREQTAEIIESMRLWAKANKNRAIARKADWIATMKGAIRKDAAKAHARAGPPQKGGGWANVLIELEQDRHEQSIEGGSAIETFPLLPERTDAGHRPSQDDDCDLPGNSVELFGGNSFRRM